MVVRGAVMVVVMRRGGFVSEIRESALVFVDLISLVHTSNCCAKRAPTVDRPCEAAMAEDLQNFNRPSVWLVTLSGY